MPDVGSFNVDGRVNEAIRCRPLSKARPRYNDPKTKDVVFRANGDGTNSCRTVDKDRPWRKGGDSAPRVVAVRTLSDPDKNDIVLEWWEITKDEHRIEAADGADLIWADDIDGLEMELQARYPAPEGFVRAAKPYGSKTSVSVYRHPQAQKTPSTAQTFAAIEAGYDLSKVVIHGPADDLLASCGYDAEEINYLLRRSRLKTIPLRNGIVLRWRSSSHYGNRAWTVDKDEDDYRAALKSIKASRRARKKSKRGKTLPAPEMVQLYMLGILANQIYSKIMKKTNMPAGIMSYRGLDRYKGHAAVQLQTELIPWHQTVCGPEAFRKLPGYKEIIKVWADERNRKKTRKAALRLQTWDQKNMLKFCDWLDTELDYCRVRHWKFARDPRDDLPKKKR